MVKKSAKIVKKIEEKVAEKVLEDKISQELALRVPRRRRAAATKNNQQEAQLRTQVANRVANMVVSQSKPPSSMKVQEMKKLDKCLASFAAPSIAPTVRMNNGFTAYKSATAKLFHRKDAFFYDGSGGSNPSESPAFVFRDQCRSFIYLKNYTTTWNYSATFTVNVNSDVQPLLIPALTFDPLITPSDPVHGDVFYPGIEKKGGRSHFWMEATDRMEILNGTAQTVNFYFFYWSKGFTTAVGSAVPVTAGATTLFTPTVAGYYGVDYASAVATTGNLQVSIFPNSAVGAVWAHLALPFAEKNLGSVDSAKIYGASIMFTNKAAPLNKQGDIASVQLPNGRFWTEYRTYKSIADLNDSDVRTAENGVYGFLKPTMPSDFDFKDQDRFDSSQSAIDSCFLLQPESDFLAVCAHITVTAGQDAYWTAGYALEYRTTDQWREQKISDIHVDISNAAVQLLSQMPQWHDNPIHLREIGDWIRSRASEGYQFIKDILPGIVSAGTTAAKVAGALIPLL